MNNQIEPSFTFTAPFNVESVEVKGQKRVFLEGVISSTNIDLVNDLVTKNCLESMRDQIIQKNLKLDLEHEAFRGDSIEETEINKTKVPVGRMFDAEVKATERNQFSLFVKSELNPFNDRYENIKGNIENKFLDAYSIAFIPLKSATKIIEGKEVRLLDDVTLLNVALTGNPINTHALNQEIFTKSINSLEDYKKEKKSNPEIMKGLEVKSEEAELKKEYPWDQCIADQIKEGYSKERAAKICGAIRSGTVSHKSNSISEENDTIKLKEDKQMSEEEKTIDSPNENEKVPEEQPKVEVPVAEKPVEEKSVSELKSLKEEVKSLSEKNANLVKEIAEIKATLKAPLLKSKVEVEDKSKEFEEKSNNPLDLIA